jgi:hypothetical protein
MTLTRLQIPLALIVLAFFLLVAFQAVQLFRERSHLATLAAAQEPTVQEGMKVRQSLDSLAGKTAKLAEAGNPNAKAIIDELRRQGIAVKPSP